MYASTKYQGIEWDWVLVSFRFEVSDKKNLVLRYYPLFYMTKQRALLQIKRGGGYFPLETQLLQPGPGGGGGDHTNSKKRGRMGSIL